jgi:hypothetical protein
MAELKTKPTGASVSAFLQSIPDARRRKDCTTAARLMSRLMLETLIDKSVKRFKT